MEYEKEFLVEQQYLEKTCSFIKENLTREEADCSDEKDQIISARKEMWEMYPSAVVLTMSWRLIRHWNRFRHNLHGMMLRTSASIITVRHWTVLILRGLTLLKTDMNPILPKNLHRLVQHSG